MYCSETAAIGQTVKTVLIAIQNNNE